MQIIKLEAGDQAALEAFKKDEWDEADRDHFGDQKPDFSKHRVTLVAKQENNIFGYLTFSVEAAVAILHSIIVGKKFRKQGVATKLITEAEKTALFLGAHKIWLETGVDWQARYLYEKLGYTVRATLPNHYGHQEFVLMDKML